MSKENVEAEFMLALIDLSAGVDIEESKARLKKYWIALEQFDEYRGVLLLKTGEVAKKIVGNHPEWGAIRKAYM